MSIQVAENEFCKLEVHYIADPEKVKAKRREAVKQLKKANIPGFRPGKASDQAILNSMKKQIDDWMKRELVSEAYDDILFETKAKPIGYPQVNKAELHDSEFWCSLTILKKPEFELQKYTGFEIPKPHQTFTQMEIVEQMLQELRLQHGDVAPYGEKDFVQVGDKITLDFTCTVDGQIFDGATRTGILYRVGDNAFPEFDDNICGMSAGEERDFDVLFGDAVPEELKSKKASFHVKVHMGMKTIPCALDDTLAQKVNIESYQKLRELVEGTATNRLQATVHHNVSQQVIKNLLAEHNFNCPEWLVNIEAQQLAAQTGMTWKDLTQEQRQIFTTQASDNVKLSLILDTIREKNPEAVFTDAELVNVLKQRLVSRGQDPEKTLVEAQKNGSIMGMLASLRNEATLQWLVEQSKIVE